MVGVIVSTQIKSNRSILLWIFRVHSRFSLFPYFHSSPNSLRRHQMEAFSVSLAFCAENSPVTGELPSQRPATRILMFSLICAWINRWVNNREASDLRRHRAHYNVIVMLYCHSFEQRIRFNFPLWTTDLTNNCFRLNKYYSQYLCAFTYWTNCVPTKFLRDVLLNNR